jgi:tetratricopeptide (TPR) repeat protein
MPFDNVRREASIVWLGEASAVLLADDLNALGAAAITREERREAFERLQVPATAILSDATVIRIAQIVGPRVVTARCSLEGDTLVTGGVLPSRPPHQPRCDRARAGPTCTRPSRSRQIAPIGATAAEVERLHPALAVFESYIKGLLTEIPATAISYLNAALAALPTFDRARLALWDVYTEQGDHAKAVAAVLPVAASSPWSRRARFLAALSYLELNKYDEAFAGFKAIADAQPTAAAAWNNLGVVQVRRGTTPQTQLASFYFNKAVETDQATPTISSTLSTHWLTRDPRARSTGCARRSAAIRPTAMHIHSGASLAAGGSTTEASRERELARRLSSKYEQWESGLRRSCSQRARAHQGRRRAALTRQVEAALATSDQRELSQFYPRSRPAVVPAGKRSRGDRRAEPRSCSWRRMRRTRTCWSAASTFETTVPRGDRRLQDLVVELRNGSGPRRPRRGLPAGQDTEAARAEAERAAS